MPKAKPVKRALIIDDVPEIAQMYSDLLRCVKGVEVQSVVEVRSRRAIERLNEERFDLVVTDYRMPEFSGAAVIEAARRTQPHARIVLLSGHVESAPEQVLEGLAAVLSKPTDVVKLIALFERLLASPP